MRKGILFYLIVLMFMLSATPSQGVPLISQGDLSSLDTIIDFEGLPTGNTVNPLTISGATFASSANLQIVDISFSYLAPILYPTIVHGNILNSPEFSQISIPITITFNQLISEVGVGIFDPNFSGNILNVFGSSGELLETVESDTYDPGGDFANFIGVIRSYNEISYVQIVPAPLDFIGIDNVTFGRIAGPIPEPCTILLVGAGLAGVAGLRRRFRIR